jgi:hypothetical protein
MSKTLLNRQGRQARQETQNQISRIAKMEGNG